MLAGVERGRGDEEKGGCQVCGKSESGLRKAEKCGEEGEAHFERWWVRCRCWFFCMWLITIMYVCVLSKFSEADKLDPQVLSLQSLSTNSYRKKFFLSSQSQIRKCATSRKCLTAETNIRNSSL